MRFVLLAVLLATATIVSWRGGQAAVPDYPPPDFPMPAAQTGSAMRAAMLYKAVAPSIYVIVAAKNPETFRRGKNIAEGSAVAITPTLALTNCHIVNKRSAIVLEQGKAGGIGTVVAADPKTDRCILKVQGMKLHPIHGVRRYGDLNVGERVYTIGNPSGMEATLGEGLVSGLRNQSGVRYVQTSAPISPGSSGGGLFDERGNLLGITTFKIDGAESLNFAIAAEDYWRTIKAKNAPRSRKKRSEAAALDRN